MAESPGSLFKKKLPLTVSLTSGEEGWLVSPVNLSLNYLKMRVNTLKGLI